MPGFAPISHISFYADSIQKILMTYLPPLSGLVLLDVNMGVLEEGLLLMNWWLFIIW